MLARFLNSLGVFADCMAGDPVETRRVLDMVAPEHAISICRGALVNERAWKTARVTLEEIEV